MADMFPYLLGKDKNGAGAKIGKVGFAVKQKGEQEKRPKKA